MTITNCFSACFNHGLKNKLRHMLDILKHIAMKYLQLLCVYLALFSMKNSFTRVAFYVL